jgi:hypothetical protein
MKAIDIIEPAKSYYLLSNDHIGKPIHVGSRIKLEYALDDIDAKMIIATSGNDKRCVILVDYLTEDILPLIQKANNGILKLKARN